MNLTSKNCSEFNGAYTNVFLKSTKSSITGVFNVDSSIEGAIALTPFGMETLTPSDLKEVAESASGNLPKITFIEIEDIAFITFYEKYTPKEKQEDKE